MLLLLRVSANISPKTIRFFTISFNQANDVYVKIYETGQLGNYVFCSTLSEFENFLLCERILINVTTCQNETSS
jgi:hypothetical protein